MNRYKFTKIKNRKYLTTKYPIIPEQSNDVYVYSRAEDRLDLLAYKYYGDVTLWWIIAKANNLKGDSMFLEPAKRIRIPVNYNDILQQFRKINS